MTVYEVAPLLQASLGAGLLLLILAKVGLSRLLVRWFALFIVGEMLWGLAVFGLRSSADLEWALRWERLTPAAVSLTVLSFYYFSRVMVRAPLPRWMIMLTTAHLLASLASIPTSYLVEEVEVASYGNTAVWGIALIPWALPIYLMMGVTVGTLYGGCRRARSYTERNRILLLFIAVSVSILGSFMDVAPALGVDVPPATSWTNSLFFILAAVAILQYNLLDIQLALQHRFSYIVRSNANLALFAAVISLFWWVGFPVWSIALIALILLLGAEPVWRKLDAVLRARLEKDLGRELQALLTLGAGRTGANTLQVADTVVNLLDKVIHPSHSVVLVIQDGYAQPLASRGYVTAPEEPLDPNHLLINWFNKNPESIFHDDLVVEPQFQTATRQSMEALSALSATIYVPIAGREALEGIIAVGPKSRGAIYSWQETEFLRALGQQAALLLESIRLSEADRAQRERMEHMKEIQRYMVQARDEERSSLAREIHDEPIQMLVGSVVRLNLTRDSLITRPELSREQLDHVISNLSRAEKSLRRIMTGVFPSLLQDLGLLAALEALCQDLEHSGLAKTQSHLTMEVNGIPSKWNPPLAVGLVIYRFIQEGVRNALSHAGASEVRITVEYGPESANIEVVDNGHGIDPERVLSRRQEGHVGLLALEERLGALGGSFDLDNRPEGGARLWGEVPHQSPSPDPQYQWSVEYDFTPLPVSEIASETLDKASISSHL